MFGTCGTRAAENLLDMPDGKTVETGLWDVIEPLQSFPLSPSSGQNIFTCAESISPCVEVLLELRDKTLWPRIDPLLSVDFHDRAKVNVDLTRAYKMLD